MRKWLFLSLIALLVLASCESNNDLPEIGDYDWCYIYDFQNADDVDYINIIKGQFLPNFGLATVNNDLVFNFTKDGAYVTPSVVVVYGRRGLVDLDDEIKINAIFSVFGLDGTINQTLPSGVVEFPPQQFPQPDPNVAGAAVNATIQTSIVGEPPITPAEIYIEQIEIFGDGISPFDTNPCRQDVTATGTPTATSTSTPTATATPTATVTTAPTGFCDLSGETNVTWSVCYDFTIDDYNFTPVTDFGDQRGVYNPGVGWVGQPADMTSSASVRTNIVHLISPAWPAITGGHLRHVRTRYTWVAGTNAGSPTGWGTYNNFSIGYSRTTLDSAASAGGGVGIVNTNGSFVFSPAGTWNVAFQSAQCAPCGVLTPGTLILTGIVIGGDSTPPVFSSATPTNTPTGTRTPTATRTPLFTSGPGGGTATRTPSRTPIMVATWTPRPPTLTSPPPPTLPPPTLDATPTYITVTPETYTPEFTSTPNPITPSGTVGGTPGGTPWGTPVSWGTPYGTPGAFDELPGFGDVYPWLSTAAAEVNKLPGTFSGYIPNPNTGQVLGYVRWLMSCASMQELLGITLAPIGCHLITAFNLAIILATVYLSIKLIVLVFRIGMWIFSKIVGMLPIISFFMFIASVIVPVVVGIAGFIGSYIVPILIAIMAFLGSSIVIDYNQIIEDVGNFLQPILDPILRVIEMFGMVISIVVGVFVALAGWLFQAIGIVGQVFINFLSTSPTPIPGLPQCVTDPMSHQICALYYMSDWTLFAPSTPGAIIVPIVIIIIDVVIIFFFARIIISWLPIGEKVTDSV